MYCHCTGWHIVKCPLLRGVLSLEKAGQEGIEKTWGKILNCLVFISLSSECLCLSYRTRVGLGTLVRLADMSHDIKESCFCGNSMPQEKVEGELQCIVHVCTCRRHWFKVHASFTS